MNRDGMNSDENSSILPVGWSQRAEASRTVFAYVDERHCVIANGRGVSVQLDGLILRTREDLNAFRLLLAEAWYEAIRVAAVPESQRRAGGQPLQIESTDGELVLRTSGTAWSQSADLLGTLSELRQWGRKCWQS